MSTEAHDSRNYAPSHRGAEAKEILNIDSEDAVGRLAFLGSGITI